MHETSIIQDLLELIEKQAKENKAKAVVSVEVQIGRLSGVEPELLKSAFDVLKMTTIAKSSKFVMDVRDVKIKCKNCKQEKVLQEFIFICPDCCSIEVDVLEGEGMYLQSLELET